MATAKPLDLSSTRDVDSDDNSPPCSFSFSRRKPLRKRSASDAVAEDRDTSKKKTKKKKKLASSVIWNEEDELAVLKGLADYRGKTGFGPRIDWDAFFDFIGGSISAKFSKKQVLSKIRKLKANFLIHLERINGGNDPHFTRSSDSEAFGYAMMIWGDNHAEFATVSKDKAEQSKSGEETFKEDEEFANAEPLAVKNVFDDNSQHEVVVVDKLTENLTAVSESHEDDTHADELCAVQDKFKENEKDAYAVLNENEAAETDFDGKPHLEKVVVDIIPEHVTAGKESHDKDIDANELFVVQDAFETMMSKGLSDYQKKLQLEKLMNLGAGKRQELSNEWKALCAEVAKINIKKLRFTAKLAEAATD